MDLDGRSLWSFAECPLYPRKRTLQSAIAMPAVVPLSEFVNMTMPYPASLRFFY
jgi:hypothetical protein